MGTVENLQHLASASAIFCDGTFYTRPTIFHQLYTIHAMVNVYLDCYQGKGRTFMFVFFSEIQRIATENNINIQPDAVFLDFEIASRNAVKNIFLGVVIKSCFFHYTQCIWRKTQAYGLQIPYRENEDVKRLVRHSSSCSDA
ncbi:hypothetical protein KUTeg_023608 [Tegillarca granosa]|uniref:MULE transposase domain-containing protein n=1 Tax=Tegillarca granosa TaxID=220873 RepID=A0ABQ9E8B5_TEGGR|nr:hypothetical protein KUTeg_023608 [Tegillarca granosa]